MICPQREVYSPTRVIECSPQRHRTRVMMVVTVMMAAVGSGRHRQGWMPVWDLLPLPLPLICSSLEGGIRLCAWRWMRGERGIMR